MCLDAFAMSMFGASPGPRRETVIGRLAGRKGSRAPPTLGGGTGGKELGLTLNGGKGLGLNAKRLTGLGRLGQGLTLNA